MVQEHVWHFHKQANALKCQAHTDTDGRTDGQKRNDR